MTIEKNLVLEDTENCKEIYKETKKEEILPKQGQYLNIIVDVNDKDNRRLGSGIVTRDDVDIPFLLEVKMLCPPFMRDRVFNTIEDKITIKRCNTQQLN
jgi:hypothetical protein